MSELDELRAEVERLRDSNRQLHRRAQQAEGIIEQSGIVEGREQGPKGRSLGRALANYAAAQLQIQLDEATARAERDEAESIRLRARIAAAKRWSSESLGADAHVTLVRILNGEPTNLSMGSRAPR